MFEVPYDLPFIAVTEKAFARLVNEQYEVLQRGIAIHKRLERLVIEERGLDELVRALAAALGGTVTVIDAAGEPIAQRTFRRELRRGRAGHRARGGAQPAGGPRGRAAETTELAPEHPAVAGRSVVLPVYTRGRGAPQAWLFAARDTGGLGDFERLILQQATTVVALELMRQRAMHDTERRLAGDVLAEALTGRLAERELASRLRPFGVGEQAAVLVFAVDDPVAEAGELDRFLHDGGHGALVAPRENLLCAVVDAPTRAWTRSSWPRRRATALGGSGGPPRAAASRPDAVGRCGVVQRGADRARGRPRIANGDAPDVASYRDMGASQLLLNLQDDEALALYCQSVLGPLEDDSGEYGEELIRSLEAFIEQNGQWEKAARQLFCHRHTLRYRIRRVEELTGRDLGTARDRIEFWLALRGREFGRHEGRRAGSRGHHRPRHRPRPGGVRGGHPPQAAGHRRGARARDRRGPRPERRGRAGRSRTVAWATC